MQPDPREPTILAVTRIIEVDGSPADIPVKVEFHMNPSTKVVIRATGFGPGKWSFPAAEIRLDGYNPFRAIIGGQGGPNTDMEWWFIPAIQPVTVIEKQVPLAAVHCTVLNGPKISSIGTQEHADGSLGLITINPTPITADGWLIEIRFQGDIRDQGKTFNREQVVGVTHSVRIIRKDRTSFEVDEVMPLLEALRWFLSFTRGAFCGMANVKGQDQVGACVFAEWGTLRPQPGSVWASWHPGIPREEMLSETFPKFWEMYTHSCKQRDKLTWALTWYLDSNTSSIHAGIVLTQMALEKLLSTMPEIKPNSIRTQLRKACCRKAVSKDIPEQFESLQEMANENNWADAVDALVKTRNALIHADSKGLLDYQDRKTGHASLTALSEIHMFGQWLFEVLLLKQLDYRGQFRNRMTRRLESFSGHNDSP